MFKQIFPHLEKLRVNITIVRNGEELICSVIPTINKGEEAVNKAIPPFNVKGKPEELDEKFGEAFEKAAQFLIGASTDMEKWTQQAKEATQKSEGAKKLKDEQEKKDREKKQKAKADVDKGDEQFKKKNYDGAKLYYKQALVIMGGKDAGLEKKIAECDKLSGPGGLFETTQPKVEVEKGTGDNESLTGPAVAPTVEEETAASTDADDPDSQSSEEQSEESLLDPDSADNSDDW